MHYTLSPTLFEKIGRIEERFAIIHFMVHLFYIPAKVSHYG